MIAQATQLKDRYKVHVLERRAMRASDQPGWRRRFWDDVKELFRAEDPRWTDWRK